MNLVLTMISMIFIISSNGDRPKNNQCHNTDENPVNLVILNYVHQDHCDLDDTGCFFFTGTPPKSSKYKQVNLG